MLLNAFNRALGSDLVNCQVLAPKALRSRLCRGWPTALGAARARLGARRPAPALAAHVAPAHAAHAAPGGGSHLELRNAVRPSSV